MPTGRVAFQPMRSPLEGLMRIMAIREAQTRNRQLAEAEKEKEALRNAIASRNWDAVGAINPQLGAWGQDRIRQEAARKALTAVMQSQLPQNTVTTMTGLYPQGGPDATQSQEVTLPDTPQVAALRNLSATDPDAVWKILEAQAEPPKAVPTTPYVWKDGKMVPNIAHEQETFGPVEANQGYLGQTNRKTGKFEKIGEVQKLKKGDRWTSPYELKPDSGVWVQRNTEDGKIVKITEDAEDTTGLTKAQKIYYDNHYRALYEIRELETATGTITGNIIGGKVSPGTQKKLDGLQALIKDAQKRLSVAKNAFIGAGGDPQMLGQPGQSSSSTEDNAIPVGRVAKNPKTGERMVWNGAQWEPLR